MIHNKLNTIKTPHFRSQDNLKNLESRCLDRITSPRKTSKYHQYIIFPTILLKFLLVELHLPNAMRPIKIKLFKYSRACQWWPTLKDKRHIFTFFIITWSEWSRWFHKRHVTFKAVLSLWPLSQWQVPIYEIILNCNFSWIRSDHRNPKRDDSAFSRHRFYFGDSILGYCSVKIIPFLVFGANGAGIFQHSADDMDCQLHTVTQVSCEAFQLTVTIQESVHTTSNNIRKHVPDRKKGV